MTITKTGLTYTATSLEDIAAEFDRLAEQAIDAWRKSHKAGSHDHSVGRKRAFQEAAAILRATKLEQPLPYAPPWPTGDDMKAYRAKLDSISAIDREKLLRGDFSERTVAETEAIVAAGERRLKPNPK